MSEPTSEAGSSRPRLGDWVPAWITAVLAISAAITLGYWQVIALGEEDTEAMESPLMLSVARQLVEGPGELYGPFGGTNPLVLIHAPLYYRLAGLAAWPMARAGLHPVAAARVAGRSLSALGLLATLAAAYRLARLDGGSRRAGWWAVLLIAASPVLAGQPVAVRPDMVGVALQTAGVLLVLSAMAGGSGADRRVTWAYAAFGLAVCVKQHLVASAAVSTILLLMSGGRVRLGAIARGLAVSAGIVAFVYVVEWVVTGGRIWEAAFVAAGEVGRVHPGGWDHVSILLLGIIHRDIGPIVLLSAVGLANLGALRGIARKALLVAGLGLIMPIIAASCLQPYWESPELGLAIVVAACVVMGAVLPATAMIERSALLGGRIDAALLAYAAAELGLAIVFFYLSTGSWMNYAIPFAIYLAVLTARAASRVTEAPRARRNPWPAALAAIIIITSSYINIYDYEIQRRAERAAAETIFSYGKLPASACFFVDRPGLNRVGGRLDLVYDDWLYPVFEKRHLAEPRSGWLGQSLRSGSVRAVVATSPGSRIAGTDLDLRRLGYHSDISVGPFFVWTR